MTKLKIIAVFTLFFISSFSAIAQNKEAGSKTNLIKFELIDDFMVVVQIKVAGKSKFFLVDTGATTSTIDTDVFQELNLKPLGKTNLITSAGKREVLWSRVNFLIGQREFDVVDVLIADLNVVKTHSNKIAGVIGNDILSTCNYFINYKEREFAIEKNDEIGGKLKGELVNFSKTDGRMLVEINDFGKNVRLVLDSASVKPILFMKRSDAIGDVNIYTVNGSTNSEKINYQWQIGKTLVVKGEGFNISSLDERTEAGLLPMNIFDSVYVNNQYKVVMFNPVIVSR